MKISLSIYLTACRRTKRFIQSVPLVKKDMESPKWTDINVRLMRSEVMSLVKLKERYGLSHDDCMTLYEAAREMVYSDGAALEYLVQVAEFERLKDTYVQKYRKKLGLECH